MSFAKQEIVLALGAKGTPDNQGVSGKAKIGNTDIEGTSAVGPVTRSYPLADIAYNFKVVSAATGNVVTLTTTTGAVAQTTGSPLINGVNSAWTAVDFEGDAIGTPAKICGIRIRTKSTNTGTVTIGGSNSNVLISGAALAAGADVVQSFPAAGQTVTGTITLTFSAASDEVWVDVLAID